MSRCQSCHVSLVQVPIVFPPGGLVARSENKKMIVDTARHALDIVAKDCGYEAIDIEGAKSDNGGAARAAANELAPGKYVCGCFAHEVFKALKRNQAWTSEVSDHKGKLSDQRLDCCLQMQYCHSPSASMCSLIGVQEFSNELDASAVPN